MVSTLPINVLIEEVPESFISRRLKNSKYYTKNLSRPVVQKFITYMVNKTYLLKKLSRSSLFFLILDFPPMWGKLNMMWVNCWGLKCSFKAVASTPVITLQSVTGKENIKPYFHIQQKKFHFHNNFTGCQTECFIIICSGFKGLVFLCTDSQKHSLFRYSR